MRRQFACFIVLLAQVMIAAPQAHAEQKVTVFAAASLTNALTELAAQYGKDLPVRVQSSFAASSALARQIENGAPGDIFISADGKWMKYLQDRKRVNAASKVDLLNNRLVLVAPKGKAFKVRFDASLNLPEVLTGRLCTGEVESVPAGIYARQALSALGWWEALKPRIVGAQDVRAALVFVERGECAVGIVYETDARISEKVDIIGTFPAESHDPVIYPAALVNGASAEARAFLSYLKSERASRVFAKYGFTPIK